MMSCSILFLVRVIFGLLLPLDIVNGLKRGFDFDKIALISRPSVLAVHDDIQSVLACATACSSASETSGCTAFQIMEDRCYLFSGNIEGDIITAMHREDQIAFKISILQQRQILPCVEHPGFRVVTMADESYCVDAVEGKLTYDEARADCHSRNAYLAFVGTPEKHRALVLSLDAGMADDFYVINAKYDPGSGRYNGERAGDVIPLGHDMFPGNTPVDPETNPCLVVTEPTTVVANAKKEVISVALLEQDCNVGTMHYFCEIFEFIA